MDPTSVVGRTLGQGKMHCRTISPIQDRQMGTPFTKRQTDMPSKDKMLFFTPELYLRYNSQDDGIALAADAEWEAAIVKYQDHLASVHEKMPSQVAELSRLCLHDGDILKRQEQLGPLSSGCIEGWPGPPQFLPLWYGLATLFVRFENELVTLFYFLCDHMTEESAADNWPFSKKREHWLYDEVHWQGGDAGRFTHLILLSSGVVLTIPFVTVLISRVPLSPAGAESGKQSA
jgi:hypothetical protein